MTTTMLITPMPKDEVPAYLRGFADWYAQSLSDAAPHAIDDVHAKVADFLKPNLGADGLPHDSVIFHLHSEQLAENVGVLWAGGADFGFGPLCYVHDLRIHPPYRRRGFARAALECLYDIGKDQGQTRGIALSVLTSNPAARTLYAASGFSPLSEIMIRRF